MLDSRAAAGRHVAGTSRPQLSRDPLGDARASHIRSVARTRIAAFGVLSAAALQCVGGSPPDLAVPIPGSTLTLVVTKEPVKHLHYGRLFDRERPISEHVMLTGYMNGDLTVDRIESQGATVSIFLSGGDYTIEVKVDLRRGSIVSPTHGRPSTPPLQK
jgi:hypothetical protein